MEIPEIPVKVIIINEDDLRRVIREEVSKIVAAGAIRPPYVPQTVPWWQEQILCGVSQPSPEGISYNAR